VTPGVGRYEPERDKRQQLSLLSCSCRCHGSPAQPHTASAGSSGEKVQPQPWGRLLQNQAAPTQSLAMGAPNCVSLFRQEPSVCTFTLDPVHVFPFPIPWRESGEGECFFVFEGNISHSRGKAAFIYPHSFPSPGFKASCQSASCCQGDIFSKLLIR